MARLLILFVALPALELTLLIEVGSRIGTLTTIGLIVLTGALGAWLARQQGLRALRRMQSEAAAGRIPASPVIDGAIILIAGALLITPGFLTDAFGFFCLIPACRRLLKEFVKKRIQQAVQRGEVWVSVNVPGQGIPPSSGEAERVDEWEEGGRRQETGGRKRSEDLTPSR